MTRARDIANVITNADLAGDIDVDGTANLDVVDIDGAVDMASTLAVSGHGSVGGNNVASNRALTVVGDTDGTSSSIIVGYNSSLAQKFSVRDDGFTTIANGLDVSDGNITFADGHGIDFSSTSGSASGSTSALLDDYEEGTWTPTIRGESGTEPTQGTHTAKYVKVGQLVHIEARMVITTDNGGSGIEVVGLPFVTDNAVIFHFAETAVFGVVGIMFSNGSVAAGSGKVTLEKAMAVVINGKLAHMCKELVDNILW